MGHRAHRGVGSGSAQRLGVHGLAGGALHEVRAAQTHERRARDHEDHVRERGQVRAARDARAHDGGDLRHVQVAAHDRIVVEDARGPVLPRKHAALVGQVHPRRVDQVHDRDPLAHGDLLRAEHLLDGLGPPRARLYGRVVGHDHHRPPRHPAQPRDHAGCRGLPVVLVVGYEEADFEPAAVPVEQRGHALARGELPLVVLAADPVGPAALLETRAQVAVFRGQGLQAAQRRRGRRDESRALGCDMLRRPLFDVPDELRGGRAGTEQLADPPAFQRFHVLRRDDAAARD